MVWPENWESLLVFIRCATQWRRIIPPMGGTIFYEGLIYSAVESVIRMSGFRGTRARDVFHDVLIMEGAALVELNRAKS